MATVGHLVAGMAVGRIATRGGLRRAALPMAALAVLAVTPDLDLLAYPVREPTPFSHRGFTHSLGFALACGVTLGLLSLLSRRTRPHALRIGACAALAMATHGVIDLLSNRGSAVTLLWPLSDARILSPMRPIPVASFSPLWRFLVTETVECLVFSPLALFALWPRRTRSEV